MEGRAEAPRHGKGPLHRLDHRVKALAALGIVVCSVLAPDSRLWVVLAYLGMLAVLLGMSRIPAGVVLRRVAAFGPFVLMAVVLLPLTRRGDGTAAAVFGLFGVRVILYREGVRAAASVFLKSTTSAVAVVLLISTTPVPLVLRALDWLRLPRALVSVIALLIRYLSLLRGEAGAMMRAARSRGWEWGSLGRRVGAAGGIVGSLFLRTYERGERVHRAMLARGFDGSLRSAPEHPFTLLDITALTGFLFAVFGMLAVSAFLR